MSSAGKFRALVGQSARDAARNGTYRSALILPVLFFLCFYTPLRKTVPEDGYATYVLPLVAVQAVIFVAIAAAGMAAEVSAVGMGQRLRSLPMPAWLPVAARATVSMSVAFTSMCAAVLVAVIFGFRPELAHAGKLIVAVVLVVVLGVALSMLSDALGTRVARVDSVQQAMLVPQMLLVMLSTGLVPESAFPEWVQGFVRNQPVSVLSDALRELISGRNGGGAAWVWVGVLFVAGAVCATFASRRRS
ncbi:ABC transporter permease [Corynebacterium felinum]|uniref:ABC-2 type transport system permease protein n=1 Tax=Corynebacterium felinum TaxID=131318 RepID=A0ABU2B9Z7_9CORY|nr:ABC transporter permease [Corynebacterium felinum]MDF5821768.1 ABC transporter permease [Corynebacterium felinum]MDR7355425.1 ABC-2 type transport system permease protein [Corynebacterium felinum]WJY94776.1 Doxorubicin resistance ABC transporter permease protein DrrB [Corynebacterium felinum]